MLQVLADENFKEQIVNGLRRRLLDLDILTVRDAGLAGIPDPEGLEWAAPEGRVLLTHDTRTMASFAYAEFGYSDGSPKSVHLHATPREVDDPRRPGRVWGFFLHG